MSAVAIAFPVLPGMSEQARMFAEEVIGPRRQEMDMSLRARGATREDWYLQTTPQGDLVIVFMEADDPARVLTEWAQSQESFDLWFKRMAGEICGIDFNQPLPALPEQIYEWRA